MIETGRVLQQRYRIDKQIGQGGMGAVYVATDERFGSTVAIKETLCMDENFRKAIEREARLLNSLKHSALPRVSDHFLEDEGQFLVMEFIPGEDLNFILERDKRPFPVETVLDWADQLLDALDFLHNQETPVVHRDIKPQNLKVTSRGQIILLDFGLAKGNPTDANHQTAAKSIFGYSRNYASLEQIQGTGTDPRSDLYSLAATLYHLSTGVPPEDALSRAMSLLSQKEDPLAPANVLRPAIPRGVAGVLHKAMDLNAGARPSSAAEMRQMFRESDNYAYLADAVTISSLPPDSQIYAQQTKLMADETRAGEVKQTDLKTEVLPAYLSELTSVRLGASTAGSETNATSGSTSVPAPRETRRGRALAVGAVGLLLVGGIVASGLYFAKPSVFGIAPDVQKTTDQGSVPPIVSDANSAALSPNSNSVRTESSGEVGTGSDGISNVGGLGTDPAKAPDPSSKPSETITNNKPTGTEKTKTNLGSGDSGDINLEYSDLPGGVVVTKRDDAGKVTTMRIDPNSRPQGDPRGQSNQMKPLPPGFDLRNLTPQQKRRLQMIMRNGRKPPPPDQ